jgi:ABC-2 type transport system ATP-binding protein
VILTTHDMDDIEALCSRVILIHQGRILFDGSMSALRARVSSDRQLTIDMQDEAARVEDPEALSVCQEGHHAVIRFDPKKTKAADLIARVTSRYAVADLTVENPPIEEIIARIYREIGHGSL